MTDSYSDVVLHRQWGAVGTAEAGGFNCDAASGAVCRESRELFMIGSGNAAQEKTLEAPHVGLGHIEISRERMNRMIDGGTRTSFGTRSADSGAMHRVLMVKGERTDGSEIIRRAGRNIPAKSINECLLVTTSSIEPWGHFQHRTVFTFGSPLRISKKLLVEMVGTPGVEEYDRDCPHLLVLGAMAPPWRLCLPVKCWPWRNSFCSSRSDGFHLGVVGPSQAATTLETFVLTENYRTEIDIRKYAKVERVLVDRSTSHVPVEKPRIVQLDCPLEYKKSGSQTYVKIVDDQDF
ncbi:chaperonin [Culex quinquefasciatus]|uniref:Chaperonin n=1 Tax=Culex quinquefasciatus TaxID=7176 RepID=B0WDD5_CULQU|nr:chaperonin [Culex quinquefasciatus]|eukprot:XP_001846719.1 chaperonin [Culex quinquefasciatus]